MSRLILPLVFGLIGTAILVSLGNWQVRRLAEKEAYLAAIDARISDSPVAIPDVADPAQDRFLPVRVAGTMTDDELHVLVSTKKLGAGYRVISAFETEAGRRIMIDRGHVPIPAKEAARLIGPMTVTGNLHWPEEIDSFTPETDLEANIRFARDVPDMAATLGTEPILLIARDSAPNDPSVTPLPVDTSGIPNDHLEYIVTWYGLAIVWVLMTLYYLLRMRKPKKA